MLENWYTMTVPNPAEPIPLGDTHPIIKTLYPWNQHQRVNGRNDTVYTEEKTEILTYMVGHVEQSVDTRYPGHFISRLGEYGIRSKQELLNGLQDHANQINSREFKNYLFPLAGMAMEYVMRRDIRRLIAAAMNCQIKRRATFKLIQDELPTHYAYSLRALPLIVHLMRGMRNCEYVSDLVYHSIGTDGDAPAEYDLLWSALAIQKRIAEQANIWEAKAEAYLNDKNYPASIRIKAEDLHTGIPGRLAITGRTITTRPHPRTPATTRSKPEHLICAHTLTTYQAHIGPIHNPVWYGEAPRRYSLRATNDSELEVLGIDHFMLGQYDTGAGWTYGPTDYWIMTMIGQHNENPISLLPTGEVTRDLHMRRQPWDRRPPIEIEYHCGMLETTGLFKAGATRLYFVYLEQCTQMDAETAFNPRNAPDVYEDFYTVQVPSRR